MPGLMCKERASVNSSEGVYVMAALVFAVIAGGLFFSTVVSLIVLPTIYSLLDDMSQWAKRVLRDARERRWPRLRAA